MPLVIFYHQLVAEPQPQHRFLRNALTREQFRASMEHVREHYHPLTVEELDHGWNNGRAWPRRSVVITFDDGFRNNLWAAEILRELDMQGTFFVLSDVIDSDFIPWYLHFSHILTTRRKHIATLGGKEFDLAERLPARRWEHLVKEHLLSLAPNDRSAELEALGEQLDAEPIDGNEDYAYFSSADLRRMRELGMTVGCHSATHDNLARCTDDELQREVVQSGRRLAEHLGEPIRYMSYPDGRYDHRVVELASRHYSMAFAASPHVPANNAWRYPRRNTGADVQAVLSPWFRPRRLAIETVKWCLGER